MGRRLAPDAVVDTADTVSDVVMLLVAHDDYEFILVVDIEPRKDFALLLRIIGFYPGGAAVFVIDEPPADGPPMKGPLGQRMKAPEEDPDIEGGAPLPPDWRESA